MKKDRDRLLELAEKLDVEIVSYGLAPNPWGHCYEISDRQSWNEATEAERDELNRLCNTVPSVFGKGTL